MTKMALAVAIFTWPVLGVTLNTNQLFVQPSFTGGTGGCGTTIDSAGPIDQACSGTGGFNYSGSGETFVTEGIIKGFGTTTGPGNVVSRGIFRDDLTFTSAGLSTGTLVSVTFWISVNGNLSVAPIGSQASWLLQADLGGGAFDINRSANLNAADSGSPGYNGDPFGLYSATVQVQIGFAAPLDVELTTTAQSSHTFSGDGSATADLFHSLYWRGITNMTVGGVPVNSFTVTSGSGVNFAAPVVPEPGTAFLLAGVCMIGWIALRRRRA